jgi:hypothetical protein
MPAGYPSHPNLPRRTNLHPKPLGADRRPRADFL